MNNYINDIVSNYNFNKEDDLNLHKGELFPSDIVPVVRSKDRYIENMYWGFKFKNNLIINARSETLKEKYMFKKCLDSRRCVIMANCFYEWKGEKKNKLKYEVSLKDKPLFFMAGIYDEFLMENGSKYKGFVIITTEANEEMKKLHHRMPVILKEEHLNLWLSDMTIEQINLYDITKPCEDGSLKIRPIGEGEQMSFI